MTWLVLDLDAPPVAGHDSVTAELAGRSAWLYRTPVEAVADRVEAVAVVEDLATGAWGAARARPATAGFGPLDERIAVHDTAPLPRSGTAATTRAGGGDGEAVIRLVPPRKRPVTGRVRFQTLTSLENVRRVDFLLDGESVATDDRTPFAATLDLGEEVRPHTVKAIAYTGDGLVLGEHEIEVNAREQPFRVEITRLRPRPGSPGVEVEATVELPPGARLDRVEFYRNETLAETRREPPWRIDLALADPGPADFVRVVAVLADGSALEDARLLTQTSERVEVNLVELHVMVGDRDGRPVRDLGPEDFTIRVGGAPRPVERFAFADEVPLVLGVVIDTSESMWPLMPDTKQAGVRFLSQVLEPQDRAFLVDFDTKPRLAQELTGDFGRLVRGFAGLEAEGFTALFDAVVFSLLQFEDEPGRKALVLLTDGDDYRSRFGPRRCVQYGRQLGVPLYVVSLAAIQNSRRLARRIDLETITEGTGGRVFYIDDLAELPATYDRINDELRSQYVLGFSTDRRLEEKELDAIEVEVARKGAEVRTVVGGQKVD